MIANKYFLGGINRTAPPAGIVLMVEWLPTRRRLDSPYPGLIKVSMMALREYGINNFSLSIYLYPENDIDNCKKIWVDSLGIKVEHIYIKNGEAKRRNYIQNTV